MELHNLSEESGEYLELDRVDDCLEVADPPANLEKLLLLLEECGQCDGQFSAEITIYLFDIVELSNHKDSARMGNRRVGKRKVIFGSILIEVFRKLPILLQQMQ